jgi:hypothetical protein
MYMNQAHLCPPLVTLVTNGLRVCPVVLIYVRNVGRLGTVRDPRSNRKLFDFGYFSHS